MRIGDIVLRIGFGLLFVWGGLEKFFEGYFGGVGLEKMAASLFKIGFSPLGENGTYVLAIWLAFSELLAGVLIILNRYTTYAGLYSAFIILVALITVYFPAGSWMQSIIHLALLSGYISIALNGNK